MERVSNQTLGTLGDSIIAGFCGDNEGIPQLFIAQFGGTPLQGLGECNSSDLILETTTEDEGTDLTITNTINTINTLELESDVRDSIIMENGTFSSVLIQVWYISIVHGEPTDEAAPVVVDDNGDDGSVSS